MANYRRTYQTDTNYDDYKIALTPGWAAKFDELVPSKSKLKPIAFSLLSELRAITIAASWPVQIADSIRGFYTGWLKGKREGRKTPQVIRATINNLISTLRDELDLETLKKIQSVGYGLRIKVDEIDQMEFDLPIEDIWDSFMGHKGFRYGIWGTQQFCFISLYNAYEHYLVSCTGIALGQPSLRKKGDDTFRELLVKFFGPGADHEFWFDEPLAAARYARHSISHSGGSETNELRAIEHGFTIIDKKLQIMATDNQALVRLIEAKAWRLAEISLALPQFQKRRK